MNLNIYDRKKIDAINEKCEDIVNILLDSQDLHNQILTFNNFTDRRLHEQSSNGVRGYDDIKILVYGLVNSLQ